MADEALPPVDPEAKAEPEEPVRLKEDDPEAFLAHQRELLKVAVHHWHWRRSALLREGLDADEGPSSRSAQEHGLEMVSNAVLTLESQAHLVDDRQAEVLWYAADLIRDALKGTFPEFPDMDVKGRLTKHGRLTTAQRNAIAVADAIARVSYRPAEEKLIPNYPAVKRICDLFGITNQQFKYYRKYTRNNGTLDAITERLRRLGPDERTTWAERKLKEVAGNFRSGPAPG